MPVIDGFDISHWNNILDHDAVPPYRLMSTKATEGGGGNDPTLADHIAMFERKGAIYQGVYHWLRSDSTVDAQVNNFVKAVNRIGWVDSAGGLRDGKLLQLDWERTTITPKDAPPYTIPDPPLQMVEDWIGKVTERFGNRIIVYSADWVDHFNAWRDRHPDFPLWYANYRLKNDAKGGVAKCAKYKADIWQWSSKIRIDGFEKGIDVNEILKIDTVNRLTNFSSTPPTGETITTDHTIDTTGDDMPTHCWAPKGFHNEFEMPGCLPVTPGDLFETNLPGRADLDPADPYANLTRTFEFHPQRFLAILHRNGITQEQINSGYFIRNDGVQLHEEEKAFYRSCGIPMG